jgi:hypothetical protein
MEYTVLAVGIVGLVATAATSLGSSISTALGTIGNYLANLQMPGA